MTEAGSHVATGKGYAKGILLDVGDAIPPGVAVSDVWMRPATNDDHVAEAEAEAA
jgi:hypothetical protein